MIPQVRAVAGGLLASSAVLGLIIGFAAQRTLGNCVAGLLIAFAQPLRLGDRVIIDGDEGIVEEIGLTYTFIRTDDDDRLVIPNEKLASDTIRNSTIAEPETGSPRSPCRFRSTTISARLVDALRATVADERSDRGATSARSTTRRP